MKSLGAEPTALFPRTIAVLAVRGAPPLRRSISTLGDFSLLVNLRAEVTLGDGRAELQLGPGDIAIWQHAVARDGAYASTLRCEARTGEWVELVIASIRAAANRESPDSAPALPVHLDAEPLRADPAIQRVLELVRLEMSGADPADPPVIRSLMDALLSYVARARVERAGAKPLVTQDARITRALQAMNARPEQRWTLSALAKLAGLSRAQFARRFTACVGMPALRYLSEWRLQLAMDWLAGGDDSVAVIAARVGYASEFAFSRAFKRFTGEAPAIFRRRLRSRNSPIVALAA